MLLDLYFHHQNSAPRSGVSRMWLIEYYQQQLALRDKKPDVEGLPLAEKRKKRKVSAPALVPQEVQALVDKAEADLDKLAQGVADASAAQLFILQLVSFAVDYPAPDVVDFMQIAARYQEKMRREDDELLLLALVI